VALAVSHALHLVLVAGATAAFARRAGLSTAAAFLAAVLYTLRGMLPLSLPTVPYFEAAAWLPVGAYAVLGLARGPTLGSATLLAVATALSLLAGYPQPTVYMVYAWGTLVVTVLAATRATPGRWVSSGLAFCGALAIGGLAAAIQLVPTVELVREGVHGSLSVEAMSPFGAVSPAWHILTSGTIAGGPFACGVAALALVAAAPFTRRSRALAGWAIGLGMLTATLALGPHGPLYGLYRMLPALDSFRFPDRMLALTDFAFALAAAIGLDVIRGDAPVTTTAGHRTWRGTMGALAALAVIGLVVWLARHGHAPADLQVHVAGFALITSGLLLVRLVSRRVSAAPVAIALVAVVTADLWYSPWPQPMAYSAGATAAWERYASEYRALAARAGPDRVWVHGGLANLQPSLAHKLATRYRVRAIDDYEPLTTRRQAEYFNFFTDGALELRRWPWLFAGGVELPDGPTATPPPATRRRLLDLAALRFVVTPPAFPVTDPEMAAFIDAAGLERRESLGGALALFENPHVLPRTYVVYRTRSAPAPAALLASLSRSDFDPLEVSYVEGAPGFAPADDAPERGAPATIVVDGERIVEIEAILARPGLVVLADTFYPGWSARVDGMPAPILATNHLFRGVPAPAGRHRIRFEYRPGSVLLGAAGSAIGWLVLAACGARLALTQRERRALDHPRGSAPRESMPEASS
jgi:hypothetical protein